MLQVDDVSIDSPAFACRGAKVPDCLTISYPARSLLPVRLKYYFARKSKRCGLKPRAQANPSKNSEETPKSGVPISHLPAS